MSNLDLKRNSRRLNQFEFHESQRLDKNKHEKSSERDKACDVKHLLVDKAGEKERGGRGNAVRFGSVFLRQRMGKGTQNSFYQQNIENI